VAAVAGAGPAQSAVMQQQQQQQLSGHPVGATPQKPILPQVCAHLDMCNLTLEQIVCLPSCLCQAHVLIKTLYCSVALPLSGSCPVHEI
jgi:hypothetical protein